MTKLNRICVFTGSNNGVRPEYSAAARELAQLFCKEKIGLVYGGAKIGIMGQLADEMLMLGGEVIGVMPDFLVNQEVAHEEITELHVVDTMHERKKLMMDFADGFLMLPGGFGTLEEFFEVLTWNKIGLHTKPFGILNTQNYFEHLITFLNTIVTEEFVEPFYRNQIIVEDQPVNLLHHFLNFKSKEQLTLRKDLLLEV